MRSSRFILLITFACVSAAFSMDRHMPAKPLTLYVALNGNDSWLGRLAIPDSATHEGPFRTLERARDEIRSMRRAGKVPVGGVVVSIAPGTYYLREPFRLTAQDSGTASSPIVYRAEMGGHVVLSGGKVVTGWKLLRPKVYWADVSKLGLDSLKAAPSDPVQPFELFYNDQRMDLARWPNHNPNDEFDGNWAYVYKVPKQGSKTQFIPFPGGENRLERWSHARHAQVHIFPNYDWSDNFVAVDSVDYHTGVITLASPTGYPIEAGRRFYIRNVYDELDTTGEWYYDRDHATLYFQPPGPVDSSQVVVSCVDTLISIDGAAHVSFERLTLEDARREAVAIKHGDYNSVIACSVRNVGEYGMSVDGYHCDVFGCDITQTGGGGIKLDGGDRQTLTPSGNVVDNCDIYRYGRLRKCYQAGVLINGDGNVVRHCLIHDAPHNAILLHGNDHIIEYNEIHDVVQESQDAGAFYMGRDWSERGNIIRYNWFHDIYGYGLASGSEKTGVFTYESPRASFAIYLDDNASGVDIYGNLFTRCALGAVMIGGGKDNICRDNIMVDCYPPVHLDARWPQFFYPDSLGGVADFMRKRLEAVHYDRPPYSTRYPGLATVLQNPRLPKNNRIVRNIVVYRYDDIAGMTSAQERPGTSRAWDLENYDPATTVVDSNLIWHFGDPVRVTESPFLKPGHTISWDKWRALGFDAHSKIADPQFVDPDDGDYRLKSSSPAFSLDIDPVPVQEIGVYEDPDRASWPVDAQRRVGSVRQRVWKVHTFDLANSSAWHYVQHFAISDTTYPLDWDGKFVGDHEGSEPTHAPGFDRKYPPETSASVTWVPADADECYLNLIPHYAVTENRVTYVRCAVFSPDDRKTQIALGSNDGAKVWVNGKQVISVETGRGAEPGQNKAEVHLRAGRNDVLVKVANLGGGWGIYLSFLDPDRRLEYTDGK